VIENALCTVSVASTWIRIGSLASMPAARPTHKEIRNLPYAQLKIVES
jgi:hypothetical protein